MGDNRSCMGDKRAGMGCNRMRNGVRNDWSSMRDHRSSMRYNLSRVRYHWSGVRNNRGVGYYGGTRDDWSSSNSYSIIADIIGDTISIVCVLYSLDSPIRKGYCV